MMSEINKNNELVDSVHERKSNSEWSQGSPNSNGIPSNTPSVESVRSSDTVNSNIRNMTHNNRPSGHGKAIKGRTKRNQENPEADAPLPPERKSVNQTNIGCSPKNLIGATICGVIIIAWVFFLFLEEGGADYFSSDSSASTTWSPPTSEQCASISNGTLIEGEPQERVWVNLELQLLTALDESNVTTLELDWQDKLQQYVIPTLAGCDSSSLSTRRLVGRFQGNPTRSLRQHQPAPRQRILQQLPDYIISHALVADAILTWNETLTKQAPTTSDLAESTHVYPLAVEVLLWLRGTVSDADLLKEKVSQVFRQGLMNATFLADLQVATLVLVSVERWNVTTGNQTVISAPVLPPTKSPSTDLMTPPTSSPTRIVAFQTMTPSDSPTIMMMNIENVTEPSPSPGNSTGNVTDIPTLTPSPGNETSSTMSPSSNATT